MIWGASFLALFLILLVLALLQFYLLRRYLRANPPDFPMPSAVNGGEPFSVPLEVHIPFLFPGFRIVWKSALLWEEGGRSVIESAAVGRGTQLVQVLFRGQNRGAYRGLSGALILEDLFGFTAFTIFRGEPVCLYVYPLVSSEDYSRETILTGGRQATEDRRRIRSEELLEVRKYYPGDDARRINWKMYASSGEMFLRIGEEIPPPAGEATICLSSDSPLVAGMDAASILTDRLIGIFLSLAGRFSEKGCVVNALIPGQKTSVLYDPAKPDPLFKILCGLTPETEIPAIPSDDFLYVVSHPGADSLNRLSSLTRKCESRVLLSSIPEEKKNRRFSSFLFRKTRFPRALLGQRELRDLSAETEKTFHRLKREGKGRIHVRIV